MQKKITSSNRGFTLIELLVVIMIIGMLSTLVFIATSTARAKGRDARRVEEIHQIRVALELYFADHKTYPLKDFAAIAGGPIAAVSGGDDFGASWNDLQTALVKYYKILPVDPTQSSCDPEGEYAGSCGYVYVVGPAGDTYDLFTRFEVANNTESCGVKNWKMHVAFPNTYPVGSSFCKAGGPGLSNNVYSDRP